MRAMLTTDMMNNGWNSKLVITTCAEGMLEAMPRILRFLHKTSIESRDIRLSSDFFTFAKITIQGKSLDPNLELIQKFLRGGVWDKE